MKGDQVSPSSSQGLNGSAGVERGAMFLLLVFLLLSAADGCSGFLLGVGQVGWSSVRLLLFDVVVRFSDGGRAEVSKELAFGRVDVLSDRES